MSGSKDEIDQAVMHLREVVSRPVFRVDYMALDAGPFTPAPIPASDVRALYEAACLVAELTEPPQ